MRKNLLIVCIGLMFTLSACGGGEKGGEPKSGGEPKTGGEPTAPAGNTLMGKIKIEGDVPANPVLIMKNDAKCPQEKATGEDYVVSNGGLKNVIVYVSEGVPSKKYPAPTEAKVIDQKGCHYIPHVFTVMTGQPIEIVNSDDTQHNINAQSKKGQGFNTMQPQKGIKTTKMFTMPEMPVNVKCDVHNWMGAKIGVFDHPYHAVSGDGGDYQFNLPPGKYKLTAWHEKLPAQTVDVEIKEGTPMEHVDFTFKAGAKPAK
jgi:plastocyanin